MQWRELCSELLNTQDADAIEALRQAIQDHVQDLRPTIRAFPAFGDQFRQAIHDHVQGLRLTVRAFLAFFVVLLGVGIMFGHDQLQAVTGAFISALGLTFFLVAAGGSDAAGRLKMRNTEEPALEQFKCEGWSAMRGGWPDYLLVRLTPEGKFEFMGLEVKGRVTSYDENRKAMRAALLAAGIKVVVKKA